MSPFVGSVELIDVLFPGFRSIKHICLQVEAKNMQWLHTLSAPRGSYNMLIIAQ